MTTPNFGGGLGEKPTLEGLADYIYRLERQLKFVLQNLDYKNIREINADIINVQGEKSGVTIGPLSDGTYGVEVKEGQYYLLDEANLRQIVGQNQNMIRDHSFELVDYGTNLSPTQHVNNINTAFATDAYWWNFSGTPYLRSTPNIDSPYSKFDNQNIIANNTNYAYQTTFVKNEFPTGPYTLSVYAMPSGTIKNGVGTTIMENTLGATIQCKLTIIAQDFIHNEIGRVEGTFTITDSYSSADDNVWVRGKLTYDTLPSDTYELKIEIKGNNAEWIDIDGVQLVPFNTPIVYNAESSLWQHTLDYKGMYHRRMTNIGNMLLSDETRTYQTLLAPASGPLNKFTIYDDNGLELRVGGSIVFSVNDAQKAYTGWLQLINNVGATSPDVGAIRANGGKLQVYNGSSWLDLATESFVTGQGYATESWVTTNTAGPKDISTTEGHTHSR